MADTEETKPVKKRRRKVGVRVTTDGDIEVRHLRHIEGPAVALADGAGAGSGPTWNQIAHHGEFKGHAAGPFRMGDDTFDEIIENFRATKNRRIPVDFEHASEVAASEGSIPHTGAPAQGWVTQLEKRGNQLWGLFSWLEPARTYVREGRYPFLSPAIRFRSRDRVTGEPTGARLTSVGLVTQPFLDGMQPLAAKHHEADLDDEEAEPAPLAARDTHDGAEGQGEMDAVKMKEIEERNRAIEAKNDELSLKLSAAEARAKQSEADVKALLDWKAKREEDDLRTLVDEAFESYRESKGLEDKHKESMLRVARADLAAFTDLYPKLAPTQRHLLRNFTGDRQGSEVPDKRFETVQEMATRLMSADPKLSKEDAYLRAEKARMARKAG